MAALLLVVAMPGITHAAVTVSRAELSGDRLRIEGTAAPNRTITVDGVAMGTSDGAGRFKVERTGFTRPPNCTVEVNDGSATATTAQLSGCSVSSPPTSGVTITTPSPLPNGNVGTEYTAFIEACCYQGAPIRWSLTSGKVPAGTQFAGDSLRLTQTTAVIGRPTTEQTTTFSVRATDQSGNSTTKSFSITVGPPRPLLITNAGDELATGRVGVSYATGVFADGGVPPYRWSVAAGALPPGLSLTTSPGRITGTPTAVGTFVFTLRVIDDRGATATRQFSITINP